MVYLLQAFGHEVHAAKEGAEGIELAGQRQPELILLDIHMPRMDGYEVARRLRDDPVCCQIPIVAVTALAMVGDKEKLLTAGFNGYISKPIDPETFPGKVQEFLGNAAGTPPSPAKEADRAAIANNSPAPQPPRAVLLFVDNSTVNLQLARSILGPQGYEIIAAASVQEGLELARRSHPDLIVSDIHMPEQDGYDFIESIHADPQICHTPFVFLSSSACSERDQQKAVAHGAIKLLYRPIEPQALEQEVQACLDAGKALHKANAAG